MLREQDLRVNVSLNEALVPDAGIVFSLGVVALAKDNTDPTQTVITEKEQFSEWVDAKELPELEGGFSKKSVHLYTITKSSDLNDMLDDISATVKTLVFTIEASRLMAHIPVDFGGVKVYTSENADPMNDDPLLELAKMNHSCAFLDPEKEGKVLYTFSELLSSYPVVGNQMDIRADRFKSTFTTKTQRDTFMEAGLSFFLQSQSGAFLWDVYAGGKQVQAVYSYMVIENQVSFSIAEWIKRGQPYTDDALLNLKGEVSRDLALLKDQDVIGGYEITMTWVKDQAPEDKVKGIVKGFNVNFNEQYRIASVNILINGEVA